MKNRFDPVEGRNAEIIEAIMSCPELKDVDEDQLFKIRLCVEEVEENILCYSGTTWVEVSVENDGKSISISFVDGGVKFDPLEKEDPDVNASLEDRKVGGLGIFLCKKMMNEVRYVYSNGCNNFQMSLNI